jgi:hypothetical protein
MSSFAAANATSAKKFKNCVCLLTGALFLPVRVRIQGLHQLAKRFGEACSGAAASSALSNLSSPILHTIPGFVWLNSYWQFGCFIDSCAMVSALLYASPHEHFR